VIELRIYPVEHKMHEDEVQSLHPGSKKAMLHA
jgi:hypothetical protein